MTTTTRLTTAGRHRAAGSLAAWHARDENVEPAQEALSHRARCNGAASLGRHTDDMEARSGRGSKRHDVADD